MSWSLIRGHDSLAQGFQRVMRRGRLAHAYLFVGPSGIGKRLFAVQLAKTLLCEDAASNHTLDSCDHCAGCIQIEAGTHPDYLYAIRPEDALEFPIDLMRDVCQRFSLKSARGRGKVVLLDDVDDLNEESANCFLKTLEEPPPRSMLILIGSTADRQLPTIVSRCQKVTFAPLHQEDVAALLRERGIVDPALLARILPLCEGSPGVAQGLCDPVLWEFRGILLAALTANPLPGVQLARDWSKLVEQAGKQSAAQRQQATYCLGLLLALLQDAMRVALGVEPRLADRGEREALETLAGRLGIDRLLDLIERCLESDQQIDRRVQLILILEALTDALAQHLVRAN